MIHTLIVDEHDSIRLEIRKMLTHLADIKIVGETGNIEAGIHLTRRLKPHVVLIDLKKPGIESLETTRRLLRSHRDAKVIALAICDDNTFPYRCVRPGTAAYITKNNGINELPEIIRKVHAGENYIASNIAQKIVLHQISDAARSPLMKLSERELQVMLMLSQGQKTQIIANKLHLSPKTVITYRSRLFEKLGVKSEAGLTHLALRYGIVDETAPQ